MRQAEPVAEAGPGGGALFLTARSRSRVVVVCSMPAVYRCPGSYHERHKKHGGWPIGGRMMPRPATNSDIKPKQGARMDGINWVVESRRRWLLVPLDTLQI